MYVPACACVRAETRRREATPTGCVAVYTARTLSGLHGDNLLPRYDAVVSTHTNYHGTARTRGTRKVKSRVRFTAVVQ